ncbi:LORF2 protein, partial [Crocuta crocuta]
TLMFIAALYTIIKIWKQPKCSPTHEWIKYVYVCIYVCVVEYYSAIKTNKILPFATTWMDLEVL